MKLWQTAILLCAVVGLLIVAIGAADSISCSWPLRAVAAGAIGSVGGLAIRFTANRWSRKP